MAALDSRVNALIAQSLRITPDKIQAHSNFIKDLGADSLDLVELVVAMEREFDLKIANDDAENMRTVDAVYSFLKKQGHA
jgi:acyl carrier protein